MNETEAVDKSASPPLNTAEDSTNQTHASTTLTDEDQLLRSLIDSLPDLIFVKDTRCRLVFSNITYAQSVGATTPDDLVGKTVFDLFPEELAQRYYTDEEAVISSGRPLLGREEPVIYSDDRQGWLLTSRVPLRDARGQIVGLAGMSRDVTRRKEVEESLRQGIRERTVLARASQAFASTLSLAEVANLVIEKAVQATKAHSAVLQLLDEGGNITATFGLSESAACPSSATATIFESGRPLVISEGQPELDNLPADWLDEGIQALVGLPLTIGEQAIGVLFIRYDQPYRFDEREIDMLSIYATQAALAIEKARLHQETRRQARQVQQILHTVPEGILLLDTENRIKLANPAAETYLEILTGTREGEILTGLGGVTLTEILGSTRGHHWYELSLKGVPPRVFEVTAQLMNPESETEGWVMVLRDVTEEREAQAQVQQQERLAAVGKLAAGIAHDFKNIVASMIGYAELVGYDPSISEMTQRNLQNIIQQGGQGIDMLQQILDFSRRSSIEKKPINLIPFVEETINSLETFIPDRVQMEINIDPGRANYLIGGDQTQLSRVLTNLATNARDAMPDGGLLQFELSFLTLEAGQPTPLPDMEPGDWITLSISDTGSGIPAEVQAHMFEPFFTTKEAGQGTGLGLAQVYGIVKQHGGEIEVDSQAGEGTTFTIYLPAQ